MHFRDRRRISIFFSSMLILAGLFCSCGSEKTPRLVIGNDFYYWKADADSNLGDAMRHADEFIKLEDKSEHNLMNVFGRNKNYVWIRADFEIPPGFKNQPLGLVIPHLRFAEQLWCNGTFISQYGAFPPHEQSTQFKAHFFSFPLSILNQQGKNTVLIKVFVYGDSGISSHAFIQPTRYSYNAFESINFSHSRIYMLLFGIMLFTFVLYLCLYISLHNFGFKEFLDFSLLNLATSFFIFYFFATEVPFYTRGAIPHLLFAKYAFVLPGYLTVYLMNLFASDYYGTKTPLVIKIVRNSVILILVLLTVFARNYDFLIKISPPAMMLVGVQILCGIIECVLNLFNKDVRPKVIQYMIGLIPFALGILIDAVIRFADPSKSYPYFTIFGWQGMVAIFLVMLSIRFAYVYKKNERMTYHLQEEIDLKTADLKKSNDELILLNNRLEKEKRRSNLDLEMASIVQRDFLPQPNEVFKGWEISTCFRPQHIVSGDLYDYYTSKGELKGLSLFDVSGHGLSASLVTMLSKNIIMRLFKAGQKHGDSVEKILLNINDIVIREKGGINNYMTGIMCRFDNTDGSGKCRVELGNAGHPYPLKYSAEDNEIFEIRGNSDYDHFGAIGMEGISVAFSSTSFTMDTDDILIFFTDGVSEAENESEKQFGTYEIKKIVKQNHEKTANEIINIIMNRLNEFMGDCQIEDDITIIIAKRTDESLYNLTEEIENTEEPLVTLEELESV